MTFGSSFGRTFSPTFQPKSQAVVAGGGWWDLDGTIDSCIAAYQPKGAASYTASKVNLTGNTDYDAANGNAYPTWDAAYGWRFNGSTQYLKPGVVISSQGYTYIIRVYNRSTGGKSLFGIIGSENSARMEMSGAGGGSDQYLYFINPYHITSLNEPNSINTEEILAMAGANKYRNGTSAGTINTSWSGTLTKAIYIGARNKESTDAAENFSNCDIYAFSVYNEVLTPTQIGLLTTAMAAL